MEPDIKKRRYNQLLGRTERKENIRTKLVMSLVNMLYCVINTQDCRERRALLQRAFDNMLEELNLTDKEVHLFQYEIENKGL